MKKYILPILAISMLALVLSPDLTMAYIPEDGDVDGTDATSTASSTEFVFVNPFGTTTSDISTLLSKIINFLILLAIPISMILVVYAGYLYMTSAGNEDKVKTAQKALIWALVGFGVVLIASSVPAIIQEFLYG